MSKPVSESTSTSMSRSGSMELGIIRFSYDARSESLEFFVAACETLRGTCDYRSDQDDREFLDFMGQAWGGKP